MGPAEWITALILFGMVPMVGLRYFPQSRAAVTEGLVESLVGLVHAQSRGWAGWFLVVAGKLFQLPVRPRQVQRDAPYRVYFVPQTRTVVAIELTADEYIFTRK